MTKNKITILVAIIVLMIALSVAVLTIGCMETAKAEEVEITQSGEIVSGAVDEEPSQAKGNWFKENWQAIIEIVTGSTALAVIFAIIKVVGKIAKLRGDLGIANVDNKAIKEAFNTMVDEVESEKKELETIHKAIAVLKSEVAVSAEKSAAVLTIFEKLISASDLPSETKQAMQAVINKATIGEAQNNDEE